MADSVGKCAKCPFASNERICKNKGGRGPDWCCTKLYPQMVERANAEYEKAPALMAFARNASIQEAECYVPSMINEDRYQPVKSRLQEIIEFCQKQGYKRLGLAFCLVLKEEARIFNSIMESHGFEMVSVVCKIGGTDKGFLGVGPEQRIDKGCEYETMCNPIAQAMVLNEENTELNILLGLCVGHDSMFMKYSEAPVTVFAVKDRLLGHNPLAALYSQYYGYLKK